MVGSGDWGAERLGESAPALHKVTLPTSTNGVTLWAANPSLQTDC
jgi:hypothetical protein